VCVARSAKGDLSLVVVAESIDDSSPLETSPQARRRGDPSNGRMDGAGIGVVDTRALSGGGAAGAYRLRVVAIGQDSRRGAVDVRSRPA
jgi:hypothetical protein